MDENPLHPAAEAVLVTVPTWTPADLVAAMAGQTEGVTARLAARLAAGPAAGPADELAAGPTDEPTAGQTAGLAAGLVSWGVDPAAPLDAGVLLEAARRERENGGGYYVRCEHVLLGMLRVTGADDALKTARADYQRLKAEQAFGQYQSLRPAPRADGAPRPCAIVTAGVPGTGKSTLAEALGRELRAPVFSMDWELGALVPFGVLRPDNLEPLSELVVAASMARQLQLGLDVVVDGATLRVDERRRLSELAEALGAVFIGVECRCSDEEVQRARVEDRSRGIPGWSATVTWEHVQRMRDRWEPWPDPHIVIDSAVEAPDAALRRVLDAVHTAR